MKSKTSSAIRNRNKKANESDKRRTKNKDLEEEENSKRTRTSLRQKKSDSEVIVSESESENSVQEEPKRKNRRLNISVAETESEDGIESVDLFDEEEESSTSEEGSDQELENLRRSPRHSPRKRQAVDRDLDSTDESNTEYFDASEKVNQSSRSTEDEEEVEDVDKNQVYYLKTVLVPLEDIGVLLQSYSKGSPATDWMFSIRRSKSSKTNGQSSCSSNQSTTSSTSDPNDDDFNLSESSTSDSEENSFSGSNYSWESECESISSSNSWKKIPRRKISSSEDETDSKSDELEEIEDDFVLRTKRKRRELRKKKYALRQSDSAIRSTIAKYCHESTDESSESSDE